MQNYFFFPDRVSYGTPEDQGLAYESVSFASADGTRLSGWFIPALSDQPKGTIVHMHGNAQNMTAHWMFAGWVVEQGYNLFVFDYRGYGQSQGVVDEKGVFEDAVAAIKYTYGREDVDSDRVVVFGQSLGGMLAIAAGGECNELIRAVVAEAPVYSYGEWADDLMPELQLPTDDACCACHFVDKLSPVALMLMHGTADKVVPYSHSQMLYKLAGEPKEMVTIEEGGHNEAMTVVYGTTYRDMMIQFFDKSLP